MTVNTKLITCKFVYFSVLSFTNYIWIAHYAYFRPFTRRLIMFHTLTIVRLHLN